jgi:glycosyltransferase involved in cell wall biosynthesis
MAVGSSAEQAPKVRAAICYHFFPHYRTGVNEALARSGPCQIAFYGDARGCDPTIKVWQPSPRAEFHDCRVVYQPKGLVCQPGALRLALSRKHDTLVFLGVAWYPTTWLAAALARLTGKRVMTWGHGWTRPERGLSRLLRRTFYKLFHAHMTYGHYGKIIFLQEGFDPAKVHVIYNSLDYAQQKSARERVTRDELARLRREVIGDDHTPIAVCTTRLVPVRRLDLLIDAAARLKREGRPIALLLVGDGPERAKLQKLAQEAGVRCVFYGACYDEAVLSKLVMMSNVMVAPGKVGLTAMTALAYGTPIVTHGNEANQMPEWEAIMPGRTGSLFADGDVADLARAIGEWTRDPWPSEAVREDCYRIIERFWNPEFQARAVQRALTGAPADDLWWAKEGGA